MPSKRQRRVNVSLGDQIVDAIDHCAQLAGMNRSSFLAEAALRWIEEKTRAVRVERPRRARGRKLAMA